MIIIKKREKDSIDKMLKRYKQKVKKTKLTKRLREGKEYVKPSATKRLKKQKAIYIQKIRTEEEKRS